MDGAWANPYTSYGTNVDAPHVRKGVRAMASVLEAIMLVCFGLSWPINAIKAWKSRTAAGTSWMFLALITFGYLAGIAAKFVGGMINWVLVVYFINLGALVVNWVVFVRNRSLDRARKAGAVASGR